MGRTGVSPVDLIIKGTKQDTHPACPRMTGKMPVPPLTECENELFWPYWCEEPYFSHHCEVSPGLVFTGIRLVPTVK